MNRTIIFDFDGTLALGHGPVLAYATSVAQHAGKDFVRRVIKELVAFDAGAAEYRDGYDVVATLAAQDGVAEADVNAAYQASREEMGTPAAVVDAPVDVVDILDDLSEHARLEIATNAPRTGVLRVLDSWGASEFFEEVHAEIGKPQGLYPIIRAAQERGPVLAVGDMVANDLEPAMELGADTALVGVTAGQSPAEVTFRGATLTDIREDLLAWATKA